MIEVEKGKPEKEKRKNRFFLLLPVAFLLLSFLTGCVQYKVGVNFDNPNHGEVVQLIKLGERLTEFDKTTAKQWLDSIEHRAKQLEGKTQRISEKELAVAIPFNYGAELEQKFNKFFNPTAKQNQTSQPASNITTDLPELNSHLKLNQSNLLLLLRNRLVYDLDLRSLSLLSSDGSVSVNPSSLLDLEFRLNTPWGARSMTRDKNAIAPESLQNGHQLVWQLKPGEINHLEAIFWLPNPLGIGTVIIGLLVAGGIYLKSRMPSGVRIANFPNPANVKVG